MTSHPKIAFITAIYGPYEATCKTFCKQSIPADFICFTNLPYIEPNGWILDRHPYHITHKSPLDTGKFVNSLVKNHHTFNIAKYYKQSFQRIPVLDKYDIVVWLDATLEITNPYTAEYIVSLIDRGENLITFEHYRGGKLVEEVNESHFERYTSTFWFDQPQPYQDVDLQYREYLADGYNDDSYWKYLYPTRPEYGLWITCFLAFNMRDAKTLDFLNLWYTQTLQYTTQDQIGFPYCCQKLRIHPYSLPDDNIQGDGHTKTDFYIKHNHGN